MKVKLQVIAIQLASLLERNFCYTLFSGNFQSNCSWLAAGSERLDSNRKTSKDQKKWGLQNGRSEKVENVQEKCRNPASVTLTCDFIITGLHHAHFLRNVPSFF